MNTPTHTTTENINGTVVEFWTLPLGNFRACSTDGSLLFVQSWDADELRATVERQTAEIAAAGAGRVLPVGAALTYTDLIGRTHTGRVARRTFRNGVLRYETNRDGDVDAWGGPVVDHVPASRVAS